MTEGLAPGVAEPRIALLVFGVVVIIGLGLFWPRRGLIATVRRATRRTMRVRLEDALKQLYHATVEGRPASPERLAGAMEVNRDEALALLSRLQSEGLARPAGQGTLLTNSGRARALRILRTHRLLEQYLADRTGVRPDEWHDVAEEREHELTVDEVETLATRIGHPRYDPHGDPIPTAAGELPTLTDLPLSALEPGEAGTIVHLEDEPREVVDRLASAGFVLGKSIVVRSATDSDVRLEIDGSLVTLPRVLAPAVTVSPHPERPTSPARTLADLAPGEAGRVTRLSGGCRGAQRRRLLDLGIVPGTEIEAELASVTGDPVAYRVRGALIALRLSQARWVELEPAAAAGAGGTS